MIPRLPWAPPGIELLSSRDYSRLLALCLALDESLGGPGRRPIRFPVVVLTRAGYWRGDDTFRIRLGDRLANVVSHRAAGDGDRAPGAWFLFHQVRGEVCYSTPTSLSAGGRRRAAQDRTWYWALPDLSLLDLSAAVAAVGGKS